MRFALPQRIESDTQQACNQLQPGSSRTVFAGPQVGCNRLGRSLSELAVSLEFEAQGRRETFTRVIRIRLAGNDYAVDAGAATEALECQHFLVYPVRMGSLRRADHDHRIGFAERILHTLAQIGRTGQFLAIAEDWTQPLRHRSELAGRPAQPLRDPIIFQRTMQPGSHGRIAMAVAHES
ncbi:MAG TPA: hypothetical protein VHQ21_06015, partial [Rhodanobacteraceae bacterium]|nr:hypothetical protein [Rhodanobacteraceae bacterium]